MAGLVDVLFLYNEVSRLSWLILALQFMKDKVLCYGFSTVNFILGCLFSKIWQEFLRFVITRVKQVKVHVSHLSAIMVGENLEGHNWSQICPWWHNLNLRRCYLKLGKAECQQLLHRAACKCELKQDFSVELVKSCINSKEHIDNYFNCFI